MRREREERSERRKEERRDPPEVRERERNEDRPTSYPVCVCRERIPRRDPVLNL